jgi:hypothetical protein
MGMMRMGTMRTVALGIVLAACASSPPARSLDGLTLLGADGPISARDLVRDAPITALVFFSAHCACQAAHDDRLRALMARFAGRVRFVLVDSEVDAAPDREAREAERRGYPSAPLVDRGGELARRFGAEVATFAVVLDRDGRVHYAGGIDSDRVHLSTDATPYLADALLDLLAGKEPRTPSSKAAGCALRTS